MTALAIHKATDGFKLYGGAREFWKYKGQEAILSGPYECLAAETRIYSPSDNSNHSIKWYHENGIAPIVQTLSGPALATIPFIKGFDALYRVTLDNGMSFVATKGHRVLTNLGWVSVSSLLHSESLRIYAASHPQSNSELALQELSQDAQRLNQTILGSQSRCSVCYHPHDEQPHMIQDSAPSALPLQADALEHNRVCHSWDAHVSLSKYTHLYQQFYRPSIAHSSQAFSALCQTCRESHACQDALLCDGDLCQLPEQSQSGCIYCSQSSVRASHDCVHTPFSSFEAPYLSDTVFNCTIVSVEFERYDFYYDLHIPVYEHYLAEGVFHHNTGKTVAALNKLHALLVKYPNSRAFITRKTYKSLLSTAIVTYEKKVLPVPPESSKSAIVKYGGSRPEHYDYPNGSHLLVVGLDNPDKLLSGEFDFGYVNQAEETTLAAWETIVGRCTGRAGNAPYTQIMGDCNPSVPTHWILHRAPLKLFEQRHEHNPSLYNQETKEWTEQGKKTIGILSGLTGIRYKRGYKGLWVSNEGVVYEGFDRDIHLIARDKAPEMASWYLAIDFGYTNPFVCQLWGLDRDGRLYLLNEIYHTKRTINAHAPKIKAMIGNRKITAIIADHDAEDRATLAEHGLQTLAAKKDISVGIQAVEERLKVRGDKKPRLYVLEDACIDIDPELYEEYAGDSGTCSTEHEFAAYEWPEGKDGKPLKEVPLDLNNHGMDALRYMVMYLQNPLEIKQSRFTS